MYNFKNDYSFGAHPKILQKLLETNLEDQQGYGEDQYSIEAKEILKKKLKILTHSFIFCLVEHRPI